MSWMNLCCPLDLIVVDVVVEEAKLVGIDMPKLQLVSQLLDGDSQLKFISVLGMGGIGGAGYYLLWFSTAMFDAVFYKALISAPYVHLLQSYGADFGDSIFKALNMAPVTVSSALGPLGLMRRFSQRPSQRYYASISVEV